MDIGSAPNTSSLGSPVTPTKLPFWGTPTLPNAPNKLIRKFSEADFQDETPCSKRPRLDADPETAVPEPKIVNISLNALEDEIQRMKLIPLSPGDEGSVHYDITESREECTGWMLITSPFAEEEEWEEYYNDDNGVRVYIYQELSDPGTSSMEATSTGASESESESEYDGLQFDEDEEKERTGDYDDTEDEADLTYDSEASSGSWTSSIEGTSSPVSEELYIYNFQGASEAEFEPMETMSPHGPDDEDMFADDELAH